MEGELLFGSEKYISSRRLSKLTNYTHDYISRLCREGKIEGKLIGRSWFVNEKSFQEYKNPSEKKDDVINSEPLIQDKVEDVNERKIKDIWDSFFLNENNNPITPFKEIIDESIVVNDDGEETKEEYPIDGDFIQNKDISSERNISPKRDNEIKIDFSNQKTTEDTSKQYREGDIEETNTSSRTVNQSLKPLFERNFEKITKKNSVKRPFVKMFILSVFIFLPLLMFYFVSTDKKTYLSILLLEQRIIIENN